MAKRRPHNPNHNRRPGQKNRPQGGRGGGPTGGGKGGGGSALGVRQLAGGSGWALVAPPCAAERAEDLEEVHAMIEAGELEIATDELRYLLSGCPELLAAHVLLGQLALDADETRPADIELARGHFGFAFALGEKALNAKNCPGPLPGADPANAPWHEAARGLAWCLEKQSQPIMADQIATMVRRFDPTDPAEVGAMLDDLRAGGLPIIELG
ncbi:hypothetical protein Pla108_02690 [Botrimarina colliarenosi]|uniref:Tetratricopeptide repeat protein n=1 Tax=Botrimarina colliarenosi TaxID=2528001 RepID=A0A5C6AH17_9BACT|nr:hypothetical protein [Botrimarina colliarenosi]TWT99332.1 hypothetical protein Pla108_02690 [Botrimarina colliarenosi]